MGERVGDDDGVTADASDDAHAADEHDASGIAVDGAVAGDVDGDGEDVAQ